MPTSTPNFSWTLPVPNSSIDANVWGTQLNGNLSAQDTQLLASFTNNIGNTAPTAPILTAGSTWINTTVSTDWIYNIYDGVQWLQIGSIDPVTHTYVPIGSGSATTPPNVFIYTSSSTYTASANISYVTVEGVGGGGGGTVFSGGGAGGGGGGYFWCQLTATQAGASIAVNIGAAGAPNGAGGSTVLSPSAGGTITATGGSSGSGTTGGAGGTGVIVGISASPLLLQGGTGGYSANLPTPVSGFGGASPVFGQITSQPPGSIGLTAIGYGNGGSGGTVSSGGSGSPGLVRIIEHF
jgi:hypothetical protein